jgi:hypothetical protein
LGTELAELAMTTRVFFDRRLRQLHCAAGPALALSIAAFILAQFVAGWFVLVGLPALVTALVVVMVAQNKTFRCPKCKENLGSMIGWYVGLKIDRKLRFCPCCGLDFDSELPDV